MGGGREDLHPGERRGVCIQGRVGLHPGGRGVCIQRRGGGLHPGEGEGVCIHGGGVSASRGGGLHPGGWADPPSDTMGYCQRAGGTHPTGMHPCCKLLKMYHLPIKNVSMRPFFYLAFDGGCFMLYGHTKKRLFPPMTVPCLSPTTPPRLLRKY